MSEPLPLNRGFQLRGRNLRHAALVLLDRFGQASIGELIEALHLHGFQVAEDRQSARKRLSDCLRHETSRGRTRRVGWGRYAIARLAPTTRWRLRLRWDSAAEAPVDEAGNAIVGPHSPDDALTATPWSVHDRHGDQVWLNLGRHRWPIGQWALWVIFSRRKVQRLAAAAASARARAATATEADRPGLEAAARASAARLASAETFAARALAARPRTGQRSSGNMGWSSSAPSASTSANPGKCGEVAHGRAAWRASSPT